MSKQIKPKIGDMPNKLPMDRLELKSKRTEYSTRYLNPDGSFTEEIFLESKFYKDSDKEWKEIDNSLAASAKRAGKLENKANSLKAIFSQQADTGEIASLEKDGMHIGLIPLDAGSAGSSAENDAVTYKNIYKDTDIRYQVKGYKLKEDIILNSSTGKNTFSFELKLKGLKAVQEDEIIYFMDRNSQKVWSVQKPYMTDAEGKLSSLVTLSLRKENRKTYVDITADQAFLSDANTKYPVTIDPTISSWDIMRDMFISGLNPNSSYPNFTSVYTGNTPSYGATRSLIRFFLPPLPSDSKITSANFNAYQTKADAANTSIDLYRITTGWIETATWNTQPTINATAESTVTSNTTNAYWQWYITQLTKDWYSGAVPNYGFMLRQQNEAATPYRAFNSVEAVTNTPRLTINFTIDPIGLEDFWGYTKDSVNPANGNLVLQQTDLSVPSRGIPVEITRTYNSRKSDATGMFGYGWKSNAEAQIIDSGSGPITFVDGDNTRHIFGQSSSGGYLAAGGIYLQLVKNVDLNGVITYIITQTDDTKTYFNAGGKITSIADSNSNVTGFTYTAGKLTTIADASGRTTAIAYGTNGFVSGITYNANRTFNYEYDTAGNLAKVTDPAGKFIAMGYDASHNLTAVTDQRNIITTISYDTANDRVSTISRPITIDGTVQTSTTGYVYDTANLVTTVTDGENRKIQYTYRAEGNVVQITENPLDPADQSTTTFAYGPNNDLTQVTTPNGNKAGTSAAYQYTYDDNGNIIQVILPENQSASYTYDNGSDLTKGRDFNGNDSSFDYDPDHNQLESTDPNMQTSASRYYNNGNLNGNLWYTTNLMSAADNLLANSS
ncbi:MAG TPA: DNRLRE domain-containing protein, partial [Anaerovoracaceae bacterium]|nr:DNRLRE domain-containing protein [Anaerovoracaceae bacterium]